MTSYRVLIASVVAAMLLSATGCASASGGESQTVYLDPDTGEVIQHPADQPPGARSSQRAGHGHNRSGNHSGYKRWKTRDGTQMLSVDPGNTPKEQVVRCADGSLRMGDQHDNGPQNRSDSAGPCGQTTP